MAQISRRTTLGWLLAGLCAPRVNAAEDDFDAEGYRARRYRAPVDRAPSPARRIALADALKLTPGRDALFLDVLPVEAGRRDPVTGKWTLSEPHQTIPGAVWHPETGRSPVDPLLWQGLLANVERAHLPVVTFCRTDCWMGWNAARRLAKGGIPHIRWLAEGIEGWHGAGRELVDVEPVTIAP